MVEDIIMVECCKIDIRMKKIFKIIMKIIKNKLFVCMW